MVSVYVYDRTSLLQQNPFITNSAEDCSSAVLPQKVYCSDHSILLSNNAIPYEAQSIVVISLEESTYYQK